MPRQTIPDKTTPMSAYKSAVLTEAEIFTRQNNSILRVLFSPEVNPINAKITKSLLQEIDSHDVKFLYKTIQVAKQVSSLESDAPQNLGKTALKQLTSYFAAGTETLILIYLASAITHNNLSGTFINTAMCFLTNHLEKKMHSLIDNYYQNNGIRNFAAELYMAQRNNELPMSSLLTAELRKSKYISTKNVADNTAHIAANVYQFSNANFLFFKNLLADDPESNRHDTAVEHRVAPRRSD